MKESASVGIQQWEASRWPRYAQGVGVATVLHLAVAASLILRVGSSSPPLPAAAPLALDLAALPTAVATLPTDQPIAPKPEEAARPVAHAQKAHPREKEVKVETSVHDPLAADPITSREVADERQAALDNVAPPSAAVTTAAALAAPELGNASHPNAHPERTWESQVLSLLERYKQYPAAARWQRQEDTVYLHLVLRRDGTVLKADITRSQGFEALDAEVIDLTRRCGSMPPPPPEVVGERVELTIPVEFYISHR